MLSKTDFLTFLDSPMHLWASTHDQLEIQTPTPYEQHLMQQGQQVEALARQYLESFLLATCEDARMLWQEPFDNGKYKIRADALIWDPRNDIYDLYEIKSSTSVRKDHIYDLAFQVLLLEEILLLRRTNILHINKAYQHGDALDLKKFFIVEDLTDQVSQERESVDKARQEAWVVSQMNEPDHSFACTKPKSCPCPSLCHPDLPEDPIYNIPYIGKKAGDLREMGITSIQDIPESFNLNLKQRKHQQAVSSGHPQIDTPAIRKALDSLSYPLYFLDYETFNPAIPLFPRYHPYEHIVFQYSLFVVEHPRAEPQHFDCLLTEPEDPAPKIVPHLLDHLGIEGSVIVWNQSFEAQRNEDLANHCPQFAERLLGINHRLYDLMRIFKDGHYVHRDFHGSASLKAVLPVMCPNLRYKDLTISSGEDAMLTWYQLQVGAIPDEDRVEVETNMKDYCRLDTFGMVEILNRLHEIIRSENGNYQGS